MPSPARAFAVVGSLALIALAGCGGGSTDALAPAGPSNPNVAGPVDRAFSASPALLHGPSHYGASSAAGPRTAHVRWQRSLGAPIVPGPVVTRDGIAYVGADNGVLHAIVVATGKDRWQFNGDGSYGIDLSTAPLVLSSGEVLWPGPRHRLFALASNGTLRWTLSGDADLLTPVLDPRSGLLIVADQSGRISGYRLSAGAGAPRRVWSRSLASASYGNPAVAADGTIYETAGDALFALTAEGRVRWTVTTLEQIEVSPAVAVNGIVVFGSNDRYEWGVNPNGRVRWREKIGNYTYSSPLTLAGRRVIYGNHNGQMTILNSDTGAVIRRDQGRGQLWTAAVVDVRGDVYFASRTGHIYGFDSAGRRLFDLNAGSEYDSYPALAPDGTLLVGSVAGTLRALR